MRIIQELRRNPDVAAIGLICLMLGVGSGSFTGQVVSANSPVCLRAELIQAAPACRLLEAVRTKLQELAPPDAPPPRPRRLPRAEI